MGIERSERPVGICLSEYGLDRHFLRIETPEELDHSRAHISSCTRCREDLEALERGRARASDVVMPTSSREGVFGEWFGRRLLWGVVLAGCCFGVMAWGGSWLGWLRLGGVPVEMGTKGSGLPRPVLLLARKRGKLIKHVRSGEWFERGDLIRVGVRWSVAGHLRIVHRDAKGKISALYPSSRQERGFLLKAGQRRWFDGSLEVEGDANGDEEIWACFSRRAQAFSAIVKVLPPVHSVGKGEGKGAEFRTDRGARVCEYLLYFVLKRRR